jgi:hypothetical protein
MRSVAKDGDQSGSAHITSFLTGYPLPPFGSYAAALSHICSLTPLSASPAWP